MAPTTYAAFIHGLEALAVAGVKRVFQAPPTALSTADLPAMWAQMPKGDESPITFQGGGGWPTLAADVLICVEPAGQNVQLESFAAQVTALDSLSAALRGADIGKAPLSWNIRAVQIIVAGTAYWGVAATVTGRG